MSSIGLFAVGTVVTLIVLTALALLVWGAVLDGRYEGEQRQASEEAAARGTHEHVTALHALDAA